MTKRKPLKLLVLEKRDILFLIRIILKIKENNDENRLSTSLIIKQNKKFIFKYL